MAIKIKDQKLTVTGDITLKEILGEIRHKAFMVDYHSPVFKKVEAICKHYEDMIQ